MDSSLHITIIEQGPTFTLVELQNGERQKLFGRARMNISEFTRNTKVKVNAFIGPGKRIEWIKEIIKVGY